MDRIDEVAEDGDITNVLHDNLRFNSVSPKVRPRLKIQVHGSEKFDNNDIKPTVIDEHHLKREPSNFEEELADLAKRITSSSPTKLQLGASMIKFMFKEKDVNKSPKENNKEKEIKVDKADEHKIQELDLKKESKGINIITTKVNEATPLIKEGTSNISSSQPISPLDTPLSMISPIRK